jgi:hypothetical protein
MTTDMITETIDFDPNISVHDLFESLHFFGANFISLNQNKSPNLPLPSITFEITPSNLINLKSTLF